MSTHRTTRSTAWGSYRESACNWLALGLLLAAWNAADNDSEHFSSRPQALRGYPVVSVRAVHRADHRD